MRGISDSDPSTIAWEQVFQARIPGARGRPHRRIAQAGHCVQEEQPAAVAQAVLDAIE